jgi:hypothetical protein
VKFRATVIALALTAALATPSLAPAAIPRVDEYPIAGVLNNPRLAARLPAGVRFYFADQPARVTTALGDVSTHRKSGPKASRKKPDPKACNQAMASSLIALAEQAKAKGANAVVGIKSSFGGKVMASATTYRCGRGLQLVAVELVGEAAVVD